MSTSNTLFLVDPIITYNPFTLDHTDIQINTNLKTHYDYISINTITITRQNIPVSVINTITPVCSVAYSMDHQIYLTLCNVSMIFYLDSDNRIQRLIGRNFTGYNEGMKNDALFESELYIAATTDNKRLIVLDTFNCVIREILVGPAGLGDFRTSSFLLHGQVYGSSPVCDELGYPRYLWPLHTIYGDIWAFLNHGDSICQVHTSLRKVACSTIQIDDTKVIKSIRANDNNTVLVLIYTYDKTFYWNAGNPCFYENTGNCDVYKCPDDYTSHPGGKCTIYTPWLQGAVGGFYIQNGIPYTCTGAVCLSGFYPGPCARNASSQCLPCSIPTTYNVQFLLPGDCSYEYIPPCPLDMYVDNNKCVLCPGIMYSTIDRNTAGFETCECPYPLVKQGQNCILSSNSQLYPMFVPNSCAYYEYLHPNTQECTMCTQIPCTLPKIGEYITSCLGQALPCIIPEHSTATSIGFLNEPKSCSWKCNVGFQSNTTHCLACNNNINTSLAYYYDQCLWDWYI
jgi:hypothetical protein